MVILGMTQQPGNGSASMSAVDLLGHVRSGPVLAKVYLVVFPFFHLALCSTGPSQSARISL